MLHPQSSYKSLETAVIISTKSLQEPGSYISNYISLVQLNYILNVTSKMLIIRYDNMTKIFFLD